MKKMSGLLLFVAAILFIALLGLLFALQVWMPFMWALLVIGIGLAATAIYQERNLIKDFWGLKTTQQGLNMGTTLLMVLLILIGFNYIAYKKNKYIDLSLTQMASLSEQTEKVLEQLNSPVDIKYFYVDGLQTQDGLKKSLTAMVRILQTKNSHIKFQTVEMNKNPDLVNKFSVTQGTGEAFLEYQGKIVKIDTHFGSQGSQVYTEQQVTNALIKASREKNKVIYFLAGHNERSLADDRSEKALSYMKYDLERKSYVIRTLDLATTGNIPVDADVLIIAGPKSALLKSERLTIESYFNQGGKVILALDRDSDISWKDFVKDLGLEYKNNYIFNISNTAAGPVVNVDQATMGNQYSLEHFSTRGFNDGQRVFFERPSELVLVKAIENYKYSVLLKSAMASVVLDSLQASEVSGSPQSYNLVYQVDSVSDVQIDPAAAVNPTGLKSEITESEKKSEALLTPGRFTIYADASAFSNQYYPQASNKDFLQANIAYMANEKDLIAIESKDISKTPLKMNGFELNSSFKRVVVFYIVPLPFLFLIITLTIWYRRRYA